MMLAEISFGDWVQVGILVLALVAVLGSGIGFLWARIGNLVKKIDTLQSNLQRAANERIDEKFLAMQHRCDERHRALDKRLQDGDEHFDSVDERNRKIELAVGSRMSETREWMLSTFVTKVDLKAFVKAIQDSHQN